MSILEDIADEIVVNPKKSKPVIRWIVRISIALVGIAFVLGEIKMNIINKFNSFNGDIIGLTKEIEKTNVCVDKNEDKIDNLYIRFDNHVYNDRLTQGKNEKN